MSSFDPNSSVQNLPAERDTSLLRVFLGGGIGLLVGSALGFYFFVFAGQLSQGPKFAQVGWLFSLTGICCGAIGGGGLGAFTFDRKPRLFLMTFLPIALLLAGQQTTLWTLRAIDRPRQYALQIEGTPGAKFAGTVLVEGEAHRVLPQKYSIRGTIPARYTYEGKELRGAFGLVDLENKEQLRLEAYADGRKLRLGGQVTTGVLVTIASSGYAESVSPSSAGWSRLTRQDVQKLVQDHEIPARPSKPEPSDF